MVLIEDQYGNVRSNDTLVVTATRSAGAGTLQGITNVTAVGGVASFSNLAHTYATNITIAFTSGSLSSVESGSITVGAGAFSQLQLLVPGETAAPTTVTGKTGVPLAQSADNSFTVTVNAVDSYWNLVNTVSDTVAITASDANAMLPANAALSGGTHSFSVKLNTAGTCTVTATDVSDGSKSASASPAFTVNAGAFAKLQVLLPGESAAPGTPTGKTGSPTAPIAGTAMDVTVRAVDGNWNVVATNDTVTITSTDAQATLPATTALSGGIGVFSLTLKTFGQPDGDGVRCDACRDCALTPVPPRRSSLRRRASWLWQRRPRRPQRLALPLRNSPWF